MDSTAIFTLYSVNTPLIATPCSWRTTIVIGKALLCGSKGRERSESSHIANNFLPFFLYRLNTRAIAERFRNRKLAPRPPGGGGGGTSIIYVCILLCRARDPHFQPSEFPFRSISFSQISKKSVPEHHHFTFFGRFCSSGDHHFQNIFHFNPFSGSARTQCVRSASPRG